MSEKEKWTDVWKEPKDYHDPYKDLSLRELIIVSCSMFDVALQELIARRLRESSKGDDLFEGATSPLSTFSGKILMAFMLGIYSEDAMTLLTTMRKLRNSCAHTVRFDFRSDSNQTRLNDLRDALIKRIEYGNPDVGRVQWYRDSTQDMKDEAQARFTVFCFQASMQMFMHELQGNIVRIEPLTWAH